MLRCALMMSLVAPMACGRTGFSPEREIVAAENENTDAGGAGGGATGGGGSMAPPPDPRLSFNAQANLCLTALSGPFVPVFGEPSLATRALGLLWDPPVLRVAAVFDGLKSYRWSAGELVQDPDVYAESFFVETLYRHGDALLVGIPGLGLQLYDVDANTGALTFVEENTTTLAQARRVWGGDGLLYVPSGNDGLFALSLNDDTPRLEVQGTPFVDGFSFGAWVSAEVVLMGSSNGASALRFDGTSFAALPDIPIDVNVSRFWPLEDRIIAATGNGLSVLQVDSTEVTVESEVATGGNVREVWSDGVHLFAAVPDAGLIAYRLENDALIEVNRYVPPGVDAEAIGITGDGEYVYLALDGGGLQVLEGFACTERRDPLPGMNR